MTVLLPTDDVALYAAGVADEHGWVEPPGPDSEPVWVGRAAVQLAAGSTDVRASDGGGHGPFAPGSVASGQVFLPPDAPAADGTTLVTRGRSYTLGQTRLVVDPTGSGQLTCTAATITQATITEPVAPDPEPVP